MLCCCIDVTSGGVPHEPYGIWLKSQTVPDPAVAMKYNVSDLFELKRARFAEIGRVSMPGNSYAIDHPQPLNGTCSLSLSLSIYIYIYICIYM